MANETEVQRWNGPGGERWIANRERHLAMRERLTPQLFRAAALEPGQHVLEVGCGCGEATIAAARAVGPDGTALGVDLSGPMLDVARRLADEAGVGNVRFVQGDAQVYPFEPASMDRVISNFGVMFFEDPRAAFGNLRAALRPGGRLAFLSWQPDERNELFAIPVRAFTVHTGAPVEPDTDTFADPTWIRDLLAGTGFVDVRVDAVSEPGRLGRDVADVMGYTLGMARVRELLDRLRDDRVAEQVLSTMEESYAAALRPDGVWVQAAAWLVSAQAGVSA